MVFLHFVCKRNVNDEEYDESKGKEMCTLCAGVDSAGFNKIWSRFSERVLFDYQTR